MADAGVAPSTRISARADEPAIDRRCAERANASCPGLQALDYVLNTLPMIVGAYPGHTAWAAAWVLGGPCVTVIDSAPSKKQHACAPRFVWIDGLDIFRA